MAKKFSFTIEDILNQNLSILNKSVSVQANAWATISMRKTVVETLLEIQSDKYKKQISYLRSLLKEGNKEKYNIHKKTLSAVTFCGTFNGERKRAKLHTYNSIIVIDVDKLSNKELLRVKECFQNDFYVFAFWESPSQEGIKGLVSLKYNFDLISEVIDFAHKSAFNKLSNYFRDKYQVDLDNSGNDITRLCFHSYDPNLVLKKDIVDFEILECDNSQYNKKQKIEKEGKLVAVSCRDALFNPKERNRPRDRYVISRIIKFLDKKKCSITFSYDTWYKVAMAISNTFTYELGEKYFLKLSSFDKEKYDEVNCKNFLLNCYGVRSGNIKFSTILYFAKEKGFVIKKDRGRSSEAASSQVSSSFTVNHFPEDLKR